MDGPSSQWQEIGGFNISFGYRDGEPGERLLETRAYDQRGGVMKWKGLAREEAMAWVMEQAAEVHTSESLAAAEQPPSRVPVSDFLPENCHEPLRMEFVDLEVRQADNTTGHMRASGRLRVYEDLAGQGGTQAGLRIEFVLVNLETNETHTAAVERVELEANRLAWQTQCDFPIPATGRYQVKAVVRTVPKGEVVTESAGPTLRVDP